MNKAFSTAYSEFCDALRAVFPELEAGIKRAHLLATLGTHTAQFRKATAEHAVRIAARDATLLRDPEFQVVPGVSLARVIDDVSDDTRAAVWQHLTKLQRLTKPTPLPTGVTMRDIPEGHESDDEEEEEGDSLLSGLTGLGALGAIMGDMSNNLTKLQDVFTNVARAAGDASGAPAFEIPEELRATSLFKLANELVTEFNPAELGLDAGTMGDMTPEAALKYMTDLYTSDPERIMAVVKRVMSKLQGRIQSGAISKDTIIGDAKRFVEFLESNETLRSIAAPLKEVFESFAEQLNAAAGKGARGKGMAGGHSATGTTRDRLRRKFEERQALAASLLAPAAAAAAATPAVDEAKAKKKPADGAKRQPVDEVRGRK